MIVIVFTSTSDLKIVFVFWWVLTFNKWSKTQQNVADAIDFKSFCIFVLSTNYGILAKEWIIACMLLMRALSNALSVNKTVFMGIPGGMTFTIMTMLCIIVQYHYFCWSKSLESRVIKFFQLWISLSGGNLNVFYERPGN